jgi:hypothetical protein
MKKLWFVVLSFAFFTTNVFAQKVEGYVESENVITSAAATPQLNTLAYGPVAGKIGWQFWGITSRAWSEGYVGPTYTPKPWVTIAAAVGAETGGARFGWGASGKKGKLFYCSLHEWGNGSGYWYKNFTTYDLNSRVSAGIWNERGKGTGPTVNVRVIKEFRPYVTFMASRNENMVLVGATYSFSLGRKK